MGTRRIVFLAVVVVLLIIASSFLLLKNDLNLLSVDACNPSYKRDFLVAIGRLSAKTSKLKSGHSITITTDNPKLQLDVGDAITLSEKIDQLDFWQVNRVFNSTNREYVSPQNLCIIITSNIQELGQIISESSENKVLQSYSTDFDYKTNTYKLKLHFDNAFYKQKAQDLTSMSYVISYALMGSLFEVSLPEDRRVIDDLDKRYDGKSNFLESLNAKNNRSNPALIRVISWEWPE